MYKIISALGVNRQREVTHSAIHLIKYLCWENSDKASVIQEYLIVIHLSANLEISHFIAVYPVLLETHIAQ